VSLRTLFERAILPALRKQTGHAGTGRSPGARCGQSGATGAGGNLGIRELIQKSATADLPSRALQKILAEHSARLQGAPAQPNFG